MSLIDAGESTIGGCTSEIRRLGRRILTFMCTARGAGGLHTQGITVRSILTVGRRIGTTVTTAVVSDLDVRDGGRRVVSRGLGDPHSGPVPATAWEQDAATRESAGRVEILDATRPGGLDGWTMDAAQYHAVRDLILEVLDDDADEYGTVALQHVVDVAPARLGEDEWFTSGRLTNYGRYTKTDMEARCEVERVLRSSPQRITRWHA